MGELLYFIAMRLFDLATWLVNRSGIMRAEMINGVSISVDDVAEWLASGGYGYDSLWGADPLPEKLRRPLAAAYWRIDGCADTVDDYMWSLKEEGAW